MGCTPHGGPGCAAYAQTMKVLRLYPEFPDPFGSFKPALKVIRKRASLPPLGLLTGAALLPKATERAGLSYGPACLPPRHSAPRQVL